MEIILKNLTKELNGNRVVNNVNLSLYAGKIYGLCGYNGCGKTMLFRALSGLMHIDSGKITVDDKTLHKDMNILESLGLIIENAGLFNEFTGFMNLKILADIKKLISDNEIRQALSDMGLDPNDKRIVRKYSLGMKQRLMIAQALMERPDIIMLDEPTNALDESGVDLVRKLILREKKRGALILLASHNKEDISILADKVFNMENGKIISMEDK